jgi:hypothetical protein
MRHDINKSVNKRLSELEAASAEIIAARPVPVDPQKNKLTREAITEITARLVARGARPSASVTEMTSRIRAKYAARAT